MLYSEDAVFLPPNQPTIRGRAALQKWMEAFPPITQFSATNDQISGRGDMAYVVGHYAMQAEGMPPDSGKYIEVRHRDADGVWRIVADIFNSNVPAPEM